MKLELIIFSITGFLIYNTYYDFKYSKMLVINKKYIQMSMFGFVGFTLYLLIKKILQKLNRFSHMLIL